tara:strand:- start:122 stop:442 length:321 start_codon:yes stop_codon:yes gene_type:complete
MTDGDLVRIVGLNQKLQQENQQLKKNLDAVKFLLHEYENNLQHRGSYKMDELRFVEMINEEVQALTLEMSECADTMLAVKGLQISSLQALRNRVMEETFMNDEDFK